MHQGNRSGPQDGKETPVDKVLHHQSEGLGDIVDDKQGGAAYHDADSEKDDQLYVPIRNLGHTLLDADIRAKRVDHRQGDDDRQVHGKGGLDTDDGAKHIGDQRHRNAQSDGQTAKADEDENHVDDTADNPVLLQSGNFVDQPA